MSSNIIICNKATVCQHLHYETNSKNKILLQTTHARQYNTGHKLNRLEKKTKKGLNTNISLAFNKAVI